MCVCVCVCVCARARVRTFVLSCGKYNKSLEIIVTEEFSIIDDKTPVTCGNIQITVFCNMTPCGR